jgi:small conductance mechanosensitive channel
MSWYLDFLFDALVAIGLLIGGWWGSGKIRDMIRGAGEKYAHLDTTLFRFLANMARYSMLALVIVFVLNRFGFETTSLVALIGAAGLAIGLAMQGTLSNLAAGMMLLGFRPFKVGDFIEAGGETGTVKEIGLFTTEIATLDNVQIIIPNGDLWNASIKNYSYYPTRRLDLVFGVGYGADLKKAEEILRGLIADDDRTHAAPEAFVGVSNLGDFSVDFTVRVWCDRGDYWALKTDLTRAVKDAFDAGGVDIPFPTRTIHHVAAADATAD